MLRWIALDLDRDAGAVVVHPAGQRQLVREPVDERPEADALHDAAHLDARARRRRDVERERIGHATLSVSRVRAPATPRSSHASHAAKPSPVVADSRIISMPGRTRCA